MAALASELTIAQRTLTQETLDRIDARLRAHFDERSYRFFSLRHNRRRLQGSLDLFLRHAAVDPPYILDIGAGAFTLDFLLEQTRDFNIVSLDRHFGYSGLFHDMRRDGLLQRTQFMVGDLRNCEFQTGAFGAIIAHDVLYEPAIDLAPLIPRFARWLRPGGTLYMDIWDARMRRLWSIAGRDQGFRRYDLAEVRRWLREAGFTIQVEAPYFGSGSALLRGLRRALWSCTRLSNTRHLIARLDGPLANRSAPRVK